jgi:hypothetical protein
VKYCCIGDCDASVKAHYWGMVKAEGWYFNRQSGLAYCPKHAPDWVEAWRAKKK